MHVGTSDSGATFSPNRRHRYVLWRRWVEACPLERMIAFIGLNPSTADETVNDPTVTRCINYADRWGYDGMLMLNIFAFRATEPKDMKAFPYPVGCLNDTALLSCGCRVDSIVCCWGTHGGHNHRDIYVRWLLSRIGTQAHHLGLNKNGSPKHPLYLRSDLERVEW